MSRYLDGRPQCLNCLNYRPDAPADEKPARDSDDPFTLWDLMRRLGPNVEWRGGWLGSCWLQPIRHPVTSTHLCGQWQVHEQFLTGWSDLYERHRFRDQIGRLTDELRAARKLAVDRHRLLKQERQRRGRS